jgi:SsrA-binding protein
MALVSNKQALRDYKIIETYKAGLILTGAEVKSIKLGRADLKGSHVKLDKAGELWLIASYIAPYPPAKREQTNYQPDRSRKLLLRSREIKSLIGATKVKGHTLIPLKLFISHGLVKLEVGLGKGKKIADKRETIKKRDFERKKARLTKSR